MSRYTASFTPHCEDNNEEDNDGLFCKVDSWMGRRWADMTSDEESFSLSMSLSKQIPRSTGFDVDSSRGKLEAFLNKPPQPKSKKNPESPPKRKFPHNFSSLMSQLAAQGFSTKPREGSPERSSCNSGRKPSAFGNANEPCSLEWTRKAVTTGRKENNEQRNNDAPKDTAIEYTAVQEPPIRRTAKKEAKRMQEKGPKKRPSRIVDSELGYNEDDHSLEWRPRRCSLESIKEVENDEIDSPKESDIEPTGDSKAFATGAESRTEPSSRVGDLESINPKTIEGLKAPSARVEPVGEIDAEAQKELEIRCCDAANLSTNGKPINKVQSEISCIGSTGQCAPLHYGSDVKVPVVPYAILPTVQEWSVCLAPGAPPPSHPWAWPPPVDLRFCSTNKVEHNWSKKARKREQKVLEKTTRLQHQRLSETQILSRKQTLMRHKGSNPYIQLLKAAADNGDVLSALPTAPDPTIGCSGKHFRRQCSLWREEIRRAADELSRFPPLDNSDVKSQDQSADDVLAQFAMNYKDFQIPEIHCVDT